MEFFYQTIWWYCLSMGSGKYWHPPSKLLPFKAIPIPGNHPRAILPIVLVDLMQNIVLETRKHFQAAGYIAIQLYIFQLPNLKFILIRSLTDHGHKPRDQMKQWKATILCHNTLYTHWWDMPFEVLTGVLSLYDLYFLLSSIRLLLLFFMSKTYCGVNFLYIFRCHSTI